MNNTPRRRPEDCIGDMLRSIYGDVRHRYRIQLGTHPEDYEGQSIHPSLSSIYSALMNHRGFTNFVNAKYVDADFFIPNPGFIVECDESQHFTEPRKISLQNYPEDKKIGYSKEEWIAHCKNLNKSDNYPPSRDEQRAWYDTIRDFLPEIMGFQPTVRLYSREIEWCKMDPKNPEDVKEFKNILSRKRLESNPNENSKFLMNRKPVDSILDEIIRFEYLTNIVKLQYLLDCTTGEFNFNSRYLIKNQKKTQILNTGGKAFHAYFNHYIQYNGRYGPLFSDRNPNDYELIKELGKVNRTLKKWINIETCPNEWFKYFCEFVLVKISLHEMAADIHDKRNVSKYGYPDLIWLHKLATEPVIDKTGLIRDFVVHCLNIGINPSEDYDGTEQEVNHLENCAYAEFQKRRQEWIRHARFLINQIKVKMDANGISRVIQWDSFAPCAYDTGPVFIRKNRGLLLPRIIRSFETYDKWDQTRLRDNLYEIIGREVTFVVENYLDHFHERQTVDFLEKNLDLNREIIKKIDTLKSCYLKLDLPMDFIETSDIKSPFDNNGISFIHFRKEGHVNSSSTWVEKKTSLEDLSRYPPKFGKLIEVYKQMAGPYFRKGGTSSKENYEVKIKQMPHGAKYFFCHFPDEKKFTIELNVYKSRAPQFELAIRDLYLNKQFVGLPIPNLWEQEIGEGTLFRMQFFYPEDTPPQNVVQGMFDLIDQTYEQIQSRYDV